MQQWICRCLLFSPLLACGNDLVGADYFGEQLYSISGYSNQVEPNYLADLGYDPLQVKTTLLWAQQDGISLDNQLLLDTTTAFPGFYRMDFYHPAPDEAFLIPPGGTAENAFAYAIPIAYHDEDDDGLLAEDEDILGATVDTYLLYLPEGYETLAPPEGGKGLDDSFEAGYNAVIFDDRPCDDSGRPLPPFPTDPAGVNIVISGDLTSVLKDVDCRDGLDEWSLICNENECPETTE